MQRVGQLDALLRNSAPSSTNLHLLEKVGLADVAGSKSLGDHRYGYLQWVVMSDVGERAREICDRKIADGGLVCRWNDAVIDAQCWEVLVITGTDDLGPVGCRERRANAVNQSSRDVREDVSGAELVQSRTNQGFEVLALVSDIAESLGIRDRLGSARRVQNGMMR